MFTLVRIFMGAGMWNPDSAYWRTRPDRWVPDSEYYVGIEWVQEPDCLVKTLRHAIGPIGLPLKLLCAHNTPTGCN